MGLWMDGARRWAQWAKKAGSANGALWLTTSLGLIGAAVAFSQYASRIAPCVTGDDPAEMQVFIWAFGLPHCTSYPLYVVLARLFSLLPLGNFAVRVNLFSAAAASLSLLAAYRLTALLAPRQRVSRWAGALLAGALLAYAHTFVAMAIISEMYTLQVLLELLVVLFLARWEQTKKGPWMVLAFAVAGASIGNHGTAAALFPALCLFALVTLARNWKRVRVLFKSVGAAVLSALICSPGFFYLLWRHKVPFDHWRWALGCHKFFELPEKDSFFQAFWFEFTSRQFRHELVSAPAQLIQDQLQALPHRFVGELFPLGAALAVLGWSLLWRRWKLNLTISALIAAHIYLAIHLDMSHKTHIYLLVPVALGAVYAGYALGQLGALLEKGLTRLLRRPRLCALLAVTCLGGLCLASLPTSRFLNERYQAYLRKAPTFVKDAVLPRLSDRPDESGPGALEYRDKVRRLASMIPDNSIVFTVWYPHFTMEYVNRIELKRDSVWVYEAYPYGRGRQEFPQDYKEMILDPKRTSRVFFIFGARPPTLSGYHTEKLGPDLVEMVSDSELKEQGLGEAGPASLVGD